MARQFRRSGLVRKLQKGMTLPELLIGGGIALFAAALITLVLWQQFYAWRGKAEGERVVNAMICGLEKARSMNSLGSATVATLLNNGCFGKDVNIVNVGATTASLATTLVKSQNYATGTCNIVGTNDGLYVQTQTGNDECMDLVEAADKRGAERISVIPAGGTELTVKAVGGTVNLGTAGLTTACKGATPVAVRACSRM